MKKIILLAALALIGMTSAYSQEGSFKAGVHAGIPVGDFEEMATFHLSADVAYRFGLAENFELGGLVGYSHFFGDSGEEGAVSWEVDDIQFLPIAASGRVNFNSFFAGADIGFAVGINDGNEGGFYYRPLAGYNFGRVAVLASYSEIRRDEFAVSALNVGIEFGL